MSWLLTIRDLPDSQPEAACSRLWELGTTGIAEVDGQIIAGFETEADAEQAAADLTHGFEVIAVIEPYNPEWPTPEPVRIDLGPASFIIDSGRSFGHGGHPTTELALGLVHQFVGPGRSLLDVGTGSGVLAIAAALLGAQPVVAVDNDPESLVATERNAAGNNVELTVASVIEQEWKPFDLVVVNMLAVEMEPLSSVIDKAAPSGLLLLTGFLDEQVDWVSQMFPTRHVTDRVGRHDWAGLVLR